MKDRILETVDALPSLMGRMVSQGRLNMGRALDNIPPATPNLAVTEIGRHSAKLTWTDTGDDTTTGTAMLCKCRYSSSAISNDAAFVAADSVPVDIGMPGESGTEHCIVLDGLSQCHDYYFALKLEDTEFNWSALNASVHAKTLCSTNNEVTDCPVGNRPSLAARGHATDGAELLWSLGAAQPSPTHGGATISYSVKEPGRMTIQMYDVAGRLVRTLADGPNEAGPHVIQWDGLDSHGARVNRGVYFYRMSAGRWQSQRRLIVLGQ